MTVPSHDDALALCAAIEAHLATCGLPTPTTERLLRHTTRHLPLPGRSQGSPFIPPLYALQVCGALAVPRPVALAFAAAGCLFFAAADLADDCADGDVREDRGIDVNDTCLLIFAYQLALLALPVETEVRLALGQLFARSGLRMAVGQEADLRATDAVGVFDPVAIARGKTGGELAAFFAGPARLAGEDDQAWGAFGEAFGTLAQILTDYLDLFLDADSDDWAAGKATLPIAHGLAHPVHGRALDLLLAGDRGGHDRKQLGLWHLVQAGAAARFAGIVEALGAEMQAQERRLGRPAVATRLREDLVDWCQGVVEALTEFAEDEPPGQDDLAGDLAACRASAHRWLAADPSLEEATEIHRHGLFAAPEVQGGLFGRAVAIEALAGEGLDLQAAWAATFSLSDSDGWRYYPGFVELPVDADCVGVMAQLAAGTVDRDHPAHAASERLLLAPENQDADGLFYTWLAEPGRTTRAEIDAVWAGGVCPGAAANAVLGLWRRDPVRLRAMVVTRAQVLAERLAGTPPPSAFYTAAGVDYMGGRALLTLRAEVGGDPAWRACLDAALEAIAQRFEARHRLSGALGNVLETAMGAFILARLGRIRRPLATMRSLIDAQEADGGYPPEPFYRTVPHPVTDWYGSRVLTTSLVLQALRTLDKVARG